MGRCVDGLWDSGVWAATVGEYKSVIICSDIHMGQSHGIIT